MLIFVLLELILSWQIIYETKGWNGRLESQRTLCEELSNLGIEKVYASYWVCYPLELYSNGDLKAGAIKIGPRQLEERHLLVDNDAFEPVDGKSCVILTKEENDQFSDAIHILLEAYEDDFVIEDSNQFNETFDYNKKGKKAKKKKK